MVTNELQGVIGRPSRWTGRAKIRTGRWRRLQRSAVVRRIPMLSDTLEEYLGAPYAAGEKLPNCSVALLETECRRDQRWALLIHEALHGFSDYTERAYFDASAWEEGVVEQLQRLLREAVLVALRVPLAEDIFADRDLRHPYNVYIEGLEALRVSIGTAPAEFYVELLRTPLQDRPRRVQQWGADPTRVPLLATGKAVW